jgi:hypothetical protein
VKLNPEFRRNLWLEWNVHRLILVGGTLAGIFVLVRYLGTDNIVANVALAMFVLTTMAWGGHRAGDSMLDELRERTWDSQRMSALDPWSMTWGKLFGATVMPWFAGAISLAVYFFERQGPTVLDRLQVVTVCVAGGILIQALSLIGALVGTRSDKQGKSTLTSWAAVGVLALLSGYFSIYYRSDGPVVWYGDEYERFNFLTVSLTALSIWMTFGVYRTMNAELAVATRPWAWIAFVVYLTVYFSGTFISSSWPLTRSLSVFAGMGLAVCIGGTYVSAFALYRDPLTFRRLRTYAETGKWRRFLEETPIWMASLSAATVFMVACAALVLGPRYSAERVETIGLTAITIWLYAVRDVILLFYFTYGPSHRRVETSTVICLALLYWVVPSIFESMGLLKVSWLVRPPMWDRPILAAVIIAVHVIVFGALCYGRYRQRIAPTVRVS